MHSAGKARAHSTAVRREAAATETASAKDGSCHLNGGHSTPIEHLSCSVSTLSESACLAGASTQVVTS
jgi:hypothetical protein